MVVSDHYVDMDGRSWFTVKTPEFDITENILAEHMLSMDPAHIELFKYFSTTPKLHHSDLNAASLTPADMDENTRTMVMDYFEVECNIGALHLIETAMISKQKPSKTIILSILDLLLHKKEATSPVQYKEDWVLIERAHDILLSALALFGPRLFDGFWDTFDQFHLTGSPKQSRLEPNYSLSSDTSRTTNTGDEDHGDTDSEEFSSHGFRAFKDFWDFVSQSFRTPADPVQAKSYLHTLDILVTLLEYDFQLKNSCSSSVKKATLLKTLQKSAEGKWDQFGKCLDILLIPFSPHIKGDPSMVVMQKEMAGRLLNLIIAVSQYEGVLPLTPLAEQAYQKSMDLGLGCFADLVEYIRFDLFILQMCQCGFLKADWSAVPKSHHSIKWEKNTIYTTTAAEKTSRLSKKWAVAFTKTKPSQMAWESIYHHVLLVKQYYHSALRISALRYDSDQQGTRVARGYDDLDDETLFAMINERLSDEWLKFVAEWTNRCQGLQPPGWQQRMYCLLDSLAL